MYEIFEKLLKEKGITAYRVAKETGVTTSTLTCWKKGKYTPKREKLEKIADYLGVSVEYLINGETKEETIEEASKEDTWNPQLTSADEKDIAKKMTAIIGDLTDGKEALMFNGEPLDDESKELLKQSLENSLRMAKVIAKRKYTPKKYRKNGSDDGENPN